MDGTMEITKKLAQQINQEHSKVQAAAESALNHAFKVGELLSEAKDHTGHGGWLQWVADNLSFGDRMARKYMQLSRHRNEIETDRNCNADLGIDRAIHLLPGKTGKSLLDNLTLVRDFLHLVVMFPPGADYYETAGKILKHSSDELDTAFEGLSINEVKDIIRLAGEVMGLKMEIQLRAERTLGQMLK